MEKKSDKTMQTNHQFSFQRLLLLGKQSYHINKKLIGISLAGCTGILFLLLLFAQYKSHFTHWGNNSYTIIFTLLFFSTGIIYASFSFPAFRFKEKTMAYLMLPASSLEKFLYELIVRIVIFLFLMPVYFWLVANMEGIIVHSFVPELTNYKFSFGEAYSKMANQGKLEGWGELLFAQGILFVLIASFTGASHFSKSPLLKTMFSFSLILAGYSLFSYLLIKGFNLREYQPAHDKILFIDSKNSAIASFAILSTLINFCLLTIAWFCLKEKEV